MSKKTFSSKLTGVLGFSDLKTVRGKLFYWGIFCFLLLMTAICLFPVLWAALSGFKEPREIYAIPPTLFPKNISLKKIVDTCKEVNIFKYFKNSLFLIAGCLAFDVVINGLCGYVLSKVKPKGSKVIEKMIFSSMLLAGMSMLPLYMTFVDFPIFHVKLTGTYWPIWMMAGANAFNVMLFRNFFNGIPTEYIEAARIDGAGNLNIFGRIILPLSKPVVMVVAIFSITGTWGNFLWPYIILANTDKQPVAVMLYTLTASLTEDESLLLAMLAIVPMVIVYLIFSDRIIDGVNMSGIKG